MGQATAQLNYLRLAPRKVRSVAGLLQGLSANEAEAQLLAQRRRASQPLLKLLRSAVANAKQAKLNPEQLFVASIRVDQGPMVKRSLPRARGMATPIQKKMSHVTLVLAEKATLQPPRFKIIVPKKTKKSKEGRKSRDEKEKQKEQARPRVEAKQPGFFRRIFSRKTAGA